MFAKLKASVTESANKVKAAVDEKKAQYEEKKQNKWLSEVAPQGEFLPYQGWKDLYEPVKKHKDDKEKESDGPNALEKKAMETLTKKISSKIMRQLTDVFARVLDAAATGVKGKDDALAKLFSNVEAILLTFRFEYKDKKKFTWLRSVAVDRLAASLVEIVDQEAKRINADPAALTPEQVEAIATAISSRVHTEVEQRQNDAVEALKSSPLFSTAQNAAAGQGVEVDADASVAQLMEFIRGYVAGRLQTVNTVLKVSIHALSIIAIKHRNTIVQHSVAKLEDPDTAPEEYKNGVKAELLKEVEGKYDEVNNKVTKFVGAFIQRVDSGDNEE